MIQPTRYSTTNMITGETITHLSIYQEVNVQDVCRKEKVALENRHLE